MTSNIGNTPSPQRITTNGQSSPPPIDTGRPSTLATQGFKITKIDFRGGPGEALVSYDRNGKTTTLKFKGEFIAQISRLSKEKIEEAVGELVKLGVATKDVYANFKSAKIDMNDVESLSIHTKDNKTITFEKGMRASVLNTASITIQKCKDILRAVPSTITPSVNRLTPPAKPHKILKPEPSIDPDNLPDLKSLDLDRNPQHLKNYVRAVLEDSHLEKELRSMIGGAKFQPRLKLAGTNAEKILKAVEESRDQLINKTAPSEVNRLNIKTNQNQIQQSHSNSGDALSSYFDEIRQQENLNPTRQRELSHPEMREASLRRTPSFLFPQIKEINENGKTKYLLDYSPTNEPEKSVVEHFQKAIKSENFIALWKFLKNEKNSHSLDSIHKNFKTTLNHILLKFEPTDSKELKNEYLHASKSDIDQACRHILNALKEVPFNPMSADSDKFDSRMNSSSSTESSVIKSSLTSVDKAESGIDSDEDGF